VSTNKKESRLETNPVMAAFSRLPASECLAVWWGVKQFSLRSIDIWGGEEGMSKELCKCSKSEYVGQCKYVT